MVQFFNRIAFFTFSWLKVYPSVCITTIKIEDLILFKMIISDSSVLVIRSSNFPLLSYMIQCFRRTSTPTHDLMVAEIEK